MTGLGFLDLVIGLIFLYFLLSIVVSILLEIRSKTFSLRANNLEEWLKDTFQKEGLAEKLLDHDLIKTLVKKGRKPAYIPDENFVGALFDIINKDGGGNDTYSMESFKASLEKSQLLPADLKRNILQKMSETENKVDQYIALKKEEVIDALQEVKDDVSGWFNNCMDRIGGTYRNMQQKWLITFSFVTVIFFNADTITLSKYLYNNKEVRDALVEQASRATQDSLTVAFYTEIMDKASDAGPQGQVTLEGDDMALINDIKGSVGDLKQVTRELEGLELPIGWEANPKALNRFPVYGSVGNIILEIFLKIIGLSITAFAVSMGSPFWFDILNKLVNLKGAGAQPGKKK